MDLVFAIVFSLGMILIAAAFCAIPVWLIIKLVRWSKPKCPKCGQRKTKCISRRCIHEGDEMHMRETECKFQCGSCGEVWEKTIVSTTRSRNDDAGSSDSSSSSSDDNDSGFGGFDGGESGGGGADRNY